MYPLKNIVLYKGGTLWLDRCGHITVKQYNFIKLLTQSSLNTKNPIKVLSLMFK